MRGPEASRGQGPAAVETGRASRRKCGVLWFLHIPKTGGSSYAAYLQSKLDKRSLHALWEFGSPEEPHSPVSFETELKPTMDSFAADPRGRLVAVHHRAGGGAEGMEALLPTLLAYRKRLEAKGCNLFLSTVLRSPDGWMESMLSSRVSPELTTAAKEDEWRRLLSTREFESGELRYLLSSSNDGPVVTAPQAAVSSSSPLSAADDGAAALDRAREILASFDAVGFTENFDEFVRQVDGMVHFPHSRIPHLNKTPMPEATALSMMSADITELASARSAEDWALYTRLREAQAAGRERRLTLIQREPVTKFCFMVIRPNSYEETVLRTAMADGGFPACTEFRIYSNVSSVGGQAAVPAVAGSMDVPNGGEYNCALNTPIFLQVYRKIFAEGDYRGYDWVVKIDADSVINDAFFQRVLDRQPNASKPLVLNNAEHHGPLGLKGALIAVTSAALALYAADPPACELGVEWADKSEDWFLGLCLIDVLKVPVRFEPQLVKQLGGGGPALCNDATHAAFHPLKAASTFEECKKRMKTAPGISLRAERKPSVFRGQMPNVFGFVEALFNAPAEWAAESLESLSDLFAHGVQGFAHNIFRA